MREQQQMACDQLGDFNWNVSRSPAELSWSFRDTVAVTRSINCGPAFSCGAACLLKVSLFVDATLQVQGGFDFQRSKNHIATGSELKQDHLTRFAVIPKRFTLGF
jgi:hypothetical protein